MYHVKPSACPDTLFRGSCTCNSPTAVGFEAAQVLFNQLQTGEISLEDSFENTRKRLADLFKLPKGSGIFLTPSGSDAEYIPLLITKLLNPGKEIRNLVTCKDEVGAGTLNGANGKYFSSVDPIEGFTDSPKKYGDDLNQVADGVEIWTVQAREPNGDEADNLPPMNEMMLDCNENGRVPIVHTVYGSKTGITEKFPENFVDKINEMGGMVVMDACQGRFDLEIIHNAIEKQACVLFTGSKFFRGPPFSGAVFVPSKTMEKLQQIDLGLPESMNTFVGQNEIPAELSSMRESLQPSSNVGLALRWEAALAEIEPTMEIEEEERASLTDMWRENVVEMIQQKAHLDYFSSASDTPSIVSVRVKNPHESKTG